jgi:RNA recognition motif-containing protein
MVVQMAIDVPPNLGVRAELEWKRPTTGSATGGNRGELFEQISLGGHGGGGDGGTRAKIRGFKVFVGRMPYTLTEDDMHHIFEPFGEIVEVTLFCDRQTGKSKGAGFVIFGEEQDASAAIAALDQSRALCTAGGAYAKPLNVKFASNKIVYKN